MALGAAGIAAVDAVGPESTASVPGQGGSATAPGIGVYLAAQFSITAIILAIAVSVGGALIAGSLGAWRAGSAGFAGCGALRATCPGAGR
jgi:hypothetical protein